MSTETGAVWLCRATMPTYMLCHGGGEERGGARGVTSRLVDMTSLHVD